MRASLLLRHAEILHFDQIRDFIIAFIIAEVVSDSLGSWYAFLVFLLYPILISIRIRDEETLLEAELSGYAEYKKRVKYRLLPFIW